jgi:hypothetical protein
MVLKRQGHPWRGQRVDKAEGYKMGKLPVRKARLRAAVEKKIFKMRA